MNSKKIEIYEGVEKEISKSKNGKMVKKDWTILAVILACVILFSFINFATINTPESGTKTTADNQYVIVEVDNGASVGDIFYYASISEQEENGIVIYSSNSLSQSSWISKKTISFENSSMYSWEFMHDLEGKSSHKYIIFNFKNAGTAMNELVLASNQTGEALPITIVESTVPNAETLFDESKFFTGKQTNTNSMYFDEIYFARTAFEILHDMPIYETSHPHLGKLLIAVGISIFGMNPFGYRIMGVLFSIFGVFALYLFGKKVFKNTTFASLMAVIFACDGLRYVQGRLATADSFLVVFIIMAYYFMYSFFEGGMDVNSIKRSLLHFCISGVFFGLAISVKWNGVYAGVGLGILFLMVLFRTINERKMYISACKSAEDIKVYNKRFNDAIRMMFISGVVFFAMVPLGIYFAVFAVTYQGTGEIIPAFLKTQLDMLRYHSGVSSVHSAASPFWSWPLNGKSVYMYLGDSNFSAGMYSRIHSMTTTAIAVYGVLALVYLVRKGVYYCKNKSHLTYSEKQYFNHIKFPAVFFAVGFLATWLPWLFIGRSTYMYHFYPTMPFYIGLIATYLYSKTLLQRKIHYSGEMVLLNGKKGSITVGQNAVRYAGILCVINFLMFFPAFSGMAIAKLPALFMFGWANGFWGFGLFPF